MDDFNANEIDKNENEVTKSDNSNNLESMGQVNVSSIQEDSVSSVESLSFDSYNQENTTSNESNSSSVQTENNSDAKADSLKASTFYSETYKKPAKKKNSTLLQMFLVAVVSSILGGGIVAVVFQYILPQVQPDSYLGKILPGSSTDYGASASGSIPYKKVEIEKSDSPITAIAEKASQSIVGIRVTTTAKAQDFGFFFGGGTQPSKEEGSGIIIRSNGYIMTNYHVIEGALDNNGKVNNDSKVEVILPNIKDKTYTAQIIGGDSKTDLAVLKIEMTGLPAAEFGNSDNLKVGEMAIAIGNPGGLEYMGSVTAGIISGLNRSIPIENNQELKLIQTDAAINPGNSGGALLNSQGLVIGVNVAKIGGDGYEGLGFAIPINKAKEITDSLIDYKYVKGRPFLGVTIDPRFTEEVANQYKVPVGLLISDVSQLSGAYNAGIHPGDIITKFDGKQVKTYAELEEVKNKHKPGDTVKIEVYRDDTKETKTFDVKLSENKEQVNK